MQPDPPAAISTAQDSSRAQIERAAAGLLYTSEGDYAFAWVSFPSTPAETLTPEAFAALLGRAGEPAAEISLDEFFARHVERVHSEDAVAMAQVPRYRALRETLRTALGKVRVFRLGTSTIDCYVVGQLPDGLGGLHTVSIET